MKKLCSLLVLVALVLAACGGGSNAVAATVDGEEITVGDVESLIDPGDESTIPKETFAQFLGFGIQWKVVVDAAEAEFGIVISEDAITTGTDEIFIDPRNNPQDLSREEFLSTNGVTEEFLRNVAHQQLLDADVREALGAEVEEPTQEEIDEMIALAEELYCASHILVATEEEANDVLDRLGAGEPFADLATELSVDTGSGAQGGDLGCSVPERFVPEFAEALTVAEVDVPTEPVESEFGFHVILLRADEVPTEEDAIQQLKAGEIAAATQTWVIEQLQGAEVTVEERYGTWQASPPQVVPPTE